MKKLPVLKKDYTKLSKKMNDIYKNIEAYKKAEQTLLDLEAEIKSKEKALAEAQKILEETDEKIKEKGFSDYLESEIKGGSLVSSKLKEKDITKASHLEAYSMVDQCKAMIRQKNIVEAKRIYMQLKDAYENINIKGHEKDMLHTAIRELYDDIKLAEMDQNTY